METTPALTHRERWLLDGRTAEHKIKNKRDNKMRRRLYTSNYIGMTGYLMDFGFGGFIGYGKGVAVELVMEELNIRMRYY